MNPRDFHVLAQKLAAAGSAAECRSAIGRAYYALFNVGAEHLRGLGFPIGRGAAAHGEVQRCLANAGDPNVADIASEMGDLHSVRNRADYQMDRPDVEKPANARESAAWVGVAIATLDGKFNGPARPQLKAAIERWRRANGYP